MTDPPCVKYLELQLRRFDEFCSRRTICQTFTREEGMLLDRISRANHLNIAAWRETLTRR